MSIATDLRDAAELIRGIQEQFRRKVAGKQVRITGWYNGQLHGTSKKSMVGTIQMVTDVSFDRSRVHVWLKDQLVAIDLDRVEFIEDAHQQGKAE